MIGRRGVLALTLGAAATAWTHRSARAGLADVRSFGAAGDGTGDDGPAIQAAIDSGLPVVRFPAGRYQIARPLRPRSGQHWQGDDATASILVQPGEAPPPPFNLLEDGHGLADIGFRDLGFLGNAARQPRPDAGGQRGFACQLRGALEGLTMTGCHFSGFGDGDKGGGGVILGPRPGAKTQALSDVAVMDCRFDSNGNVPGLYLSGGEQSGVRRRNLRISGNRFGGGTGHRYQNCLYILGSSPETRITGVTISDNTFDLDSPIDAAIELNWAETFTITGNAITFKTALDGSAGLLIRDGCRGGAITGNSLSDQSGGREVGGILLLNFADPATVEDITITGNSLTGFTWRAIACDRGSRGISVTGNRIASSTPMTAEAIRVAGARDVLIAHNSISNAVHPVVIAGQGSSQAADITLDGNSFHQCGGTAGLIDTSAAPDLTGLVITGNRAIASRPGTGGLIAGLADQSHALIISNLTDGLPSMAP